MPNLAPVDYSRYSFKSGWNNELLGKAMLYKQEKYDAGREKLQGMYDQLTGIDLAKPEDRAYFDEKLKMLEKEVQIAGMGDLGRAGVAEHIASFIGQAADDKVLNGYVGTVSGAKIKQQAYQTQQKNPEKYSDLNLDYSLRDYNAWVNDGKVGSTYRGGTNYVPYTDIVDKANKVIKELEPNAYVKFNPLNGSEFTMYKESGEELSSPQIRAALEATIMQDPNVVQQMQINGWGEFRSMPDTAFIDLTKTGIQAEIKNYDKQISTLRQKLLSPSSAKGNQLKDINNSITLFESERKKYTELLGSPDDKLLAQKDNIAFQIYKDRFITQTSDAFTYSKVKDKGFETYQEGLVKWKAQQEIALEKDKQAVDVRKKLAEISINKTPAEALEYGKIAFPQMSEQGLKDILYTNTNFVPTTAETVNQPTSYYQTAPDNMANNTLQTWQNTQKNILGFFKDKNHFGFQDAFSNLTNSERTESELNKMTEKDWNAHLAENKVTGSWKNFQNTRDQYAIAKKDYYVASNLRNDINEKLDTQVISKMKQDKDWHDVKDKDLRVKHYYGDVYVAEKRVQTGTNVSAKTGIATPVYEYRPIETGVTSATGQKGLMQQQDLLQFLNNQYGNVSENQNLAKMFPDLIQQKTYEEKFNETYGTGITGAGKEILSESDALWARELIKQVGTNNLTPAFKAKLDGKVKNALYNGTLEQLMENQLKNKEGDDKTLPVFEGMRFVSNPSGSYIEIDGVQQPLDSRILTNSYEGQQLLTSQQTLSEKVREENWQRIVTKEHPNDIYEGEKETFDSKIPVDINGTNVEWGADIMYQIHTDRDYSEQVVPILIIKNEAGIVLANEEISTYTDLFTAKQKVEQYKQNGTLSAVTKALMEQKAEEIEKQTK